jgi:GntR family transcriptional regulator
MIEQTWAPHHRRIEQVLRERIFALKPGDRLPSDAQLVAEFGVSRMTARSAMQRLAEEGLVARHPGRGSFVAPSAPHRRTDRLLTFTSEMARRGRVPSSHLLARSMRPSTRTEAAALDLRPGEPVVEVRRVRLADGEPIALESTVLVAACARTVLVADLEHGSLHAAILAGGVGLHRGTGTVSAAAATAEDARLLAIRRGDPLLVESRVILDEDGRRIESTESRYPADRYALDVSFDVERSAQSAEERAP